MHSQRRQGKRPLHLLDLYRRGEFAEVGVALDNDLNASSALPADLINLRARLYIKEDAPGGLPVPQPAQARL